MSRIAEYQRTSEFLPPSEAYSDLLLATGNPQDGNQSFTDVAFVEDRLFPAISSPVLTIDQTAIDINNNFRNSNGTLPPLELSAIQAAIPQEGIHFGIQIAVGGNITRLMPRDYNPLDETLTTVRRVLTLSQSGKTQAYDMWKVKGRIFTRPLNPRLKPGFWHQLAGSMPFRRN